MGNLWKMLFETVDIAFLLLMSSFPKAEFSWLIETVKAYELNQKYCKFENVRLQVPDVLLEYLWRVKSLGDLSRSTIFVSTRYNIYR